MAGKLGKFQMTGFQHWKGLTKENHLGSIFQQSPQKATNLMVQLLAYQRGKTLDTFLNQFPVREFEDDSEYYWEVIGSSRRNIPLVEARDQNGVPVTMHSGRVMQVQAQLLSIWYFQKIGLLMVNTSLVI